MFWTAGRVLAAVQPDLDLTMLAEETTALEAVVDHDRVIQELFALAPVLPLRFATVFSSADALSEHLLAHQDLYLARLDQLQDRVEFTLRLTPVVLAPTVANAAEGRAYFQQRKQQYQQVQDRQQQQRAEQEHLFTHLQTLGVHYVLEGERVHLLVPRALGVFLIPLTHWEVTLTGPLPPYHFV